MQVAEKVTEEPQTPTQPSTSQPVADEDDLSPEQLEAALARLRKAMHVAEPDTAASAAVKGAAKNVKEEELGDDSPALEAGVDGAEAALEPKDDSEPSATARTSSESKRDDSSEPGEPSHAIPPHCMNDCCPTKLLDILGLVYCHYESLSSE